MKPLAIIIRTAGTNCDGELAYAFELAAASTQTVHLNALIDDPTWLQRADLIGLPGGFSYGDDIAAGRIFANRIRHHLLDPLRAAVARGVPVIGICNGFQVLVKAGLLPGPVGAEGGRQLASLADNIGGRFIARWVQLEVPRDTACVWVRGLDRFELPIAHGEGRFVPASDGVLARMREGHQIAMRYAAQPPCAPPSGDDFGGADDGPRVTGHGGGNPNGSVDRIAGICDSTGLVFGLMPHPERYTCLTQHPAWTRQPASVRVQTPVGLAMFKNAVAYVCGARVAPAPAGASGPAH